MAVPTYDAMMAPMLALAAKGPISRKASADIIADHFKLSPEDREARIPSGNSTLVRNRVAWATTFLTKAKLIEKVSLPWCHSIDGLGHR
jgi:restriction system protein